MGLGSNIFGCNNLSNVLLGKATLGCIRDIGRWVGVGLGSNIFGCNSYSQILSLSKN